MTIDRNDPALHEIIQEGPRKGQQRDYLVLSEEERAKGFVMPVYRSYRHMKCGTDTRMGQELCETYARNPKFYGGTFCCHCGTHFGLFTYEKGPLDILDIAAGRILHRVAHFYWVEQDGDRIVPVGAGPEEAALLWDEKRRKDAEKHIGGGI